MKTFAGGAALGPHSCRKYFLLVQESMVQWEDWSMRMEKKKTQDSNFIWNIGFDWYLSVSVCLQIHYLVTGLLTGALPLIHRLPQNSFFFFFLHIWDKIPVPVWLSCKLSLWASGFGQWSYHTSGLNHSACTKLTLTHKKCFCVIWWCLRSFISKPHVKIPYYKLLFKPTNYFCIQCGKMWLHRVWFIDSTAATEKWLRKIWCTFVKLK